MQAESTSQGLNSTGKGDGNEREKAGYWDDKANWGLGLRNLDRSDLLAPN
jgi:hypothetical protein